MYLKKNIVKSSSLIIFNQTSFHKGSCLFLYKGAPAIVGEKKTNSSG